MARKLQCKLATLHNTSAHSGSCKRKMCNNQYDNISLCSSRSLQSDHEECNALIPGLDPTTQRQNISHKLLEDSKGLGSDFGNSSFASIPYSLPAHLDYQFPIDSDTDLRPAKVLTGYTREVESSLASREDLQCNWGESRQASITTHDADPLQLLPPGSNILIQAILSIVAIIIFFVYFILSSHFIPNRTSSIPIQ